MSILVEISTNRAAPSVTEVRTNVAGSVREHFVAPFCRFFVFPHAFLPR